MLHNDIILKVYDIINERWELSIGRLMCEVREYSDMTEIPGKGTKDQTWEKCVVWKVS